MPLRAQGIGGSSEVASEDPPLERLTIAFEYHVGLIDHALQADQSTPAAFDLRPLQLLEEEECVRDEIAQCGGDIVDGLWRDGLDAEALA